MIERIDLLRNIGQFHNVAPSENIVFTPFTLIYAENGRGKTTIAEVLRSLASDSPSLIVERKRLGAHHNPHVVVSQNGEKAVFQNGAWSKTVPDIAIFDDSFVAANICSGTDFQASHRQKLHELIIGAQGVTLSNELEGHVRRIEQHNTDLREKKNAIPGVTRGPYDVNTFCALQTDPDIDAKLLKAKRRLAAAKSADAIRQRAGFIGLHMPDFDTVAINTVLAQTIGSLEADAAARVRRHLDSLGPDGEAWVAEGMSRTAKASEDKEEEVCPFCAQELAGSDIISLYQAYFSKAYEDLRAEITDVQNKLRGAHGDNIPAAFERSIHTAVQNRGFWKDFTELPAIDVDTAAISRDWTTALEAVLDHLRQKLASPLEPIELSGEAIDAVQTYRSRINEIREISDRLLECNERLDTVKEQVEVTDVAALTDDLDKIKAQKARFEPAVVPLCDSYLAEKAAKDATELQRDQSRDALKEYREQIFPAYEVSINDFLRRFNATFRLDQVRPTNTRAGPSASYAVVINQQEVNIAAKDGPSFRNTLSAGDRNTLALAFFFASLEQDQNIAQKIVILDDPMTSLDEHRSLRTRQEIFDLHGRVSQMIVLSHSKPFLCALWDNADVKVRSAFRVGRIDNGSELATWDVRKDSITEHDKRHELVSNYVHADDPDSERKVAEALRPILEAFVRVAYPGHFPPGSHLGRFVSRCQEHHGGADEILSEADTNELRALLDYANRFHHDSNPAWETEVINDTELVDFARRTLLFTSRR